MKDETKNKIITIGFAIILITVFIINIAIKDKTISTTERRKLAQFPEITVKKLLNGEVAKKWEDYAVDQFVARDYLREVKSFYNTNIYKQKDNNKLFEKDGTIYKMEYPLNTNNIIKSAEKIKEVQKKYLKNNNVYYAIIPDKNYYLQNDDHLKIDYQALKQTMESKLQNMQYINIWNSLTLEDYYKTDLHWKQEKLQNTVEVLQKYMNLEPVSTKYDKIEVENFYGAYYGQLAANVSADKMYILNNKTIENCITYNYETNKTGKVYAKPTSSDKYDIYLSGATPLITIENKNASTQKELLLFRDSFGSSIAPLLMENYKKITLIDLRYISSTLLDQYIDFNNQDVLFLYSTLILNQNILK